MLGWGLIVTASAIAAMLPHFSGCWSCFRFWGTQPGICIRKLSSPRSEVLQASPARKLRINW